MRIKLVVDVGKNKAGSIDSPPYRVAEILIREGKAIRFDPQSNRKNVGEPPNDKMIRYSKTK